MGDSPSNLPIDPSGSGDLILAFIMVAIVIVGFLLYERFMNPDNDWKYRWKKKSKR